MFVVGLTGGIGSGKSTVAALFAEHDIPIIDADRIARDLVEPGQPALAEITRTFGREILDTQGRLDRAKLRSRIFENADDRKQLEAILHPRIRESMLVQLDTLSAPYAILVIPLLIDTGYWEMIDRILVIDVDEETQLQRVIERDGISREQAQSIIDSQVSREDRLTAADDVIENDSGVDVLHAQVEALHKKYLLSAHQDNNYQKDGYGKKNASAHQETAKTAGKCIYEQPLNERIRTFLRFENLHARANYHLQSNTPHDAHALTCVMIEIGNLVTRGEFKSEIIKELERQHVSIGRHAHLSGIDHAKLSELQQRQSTLLARLHDQQEALGQHIKSDLLLNSVRQRLTAPGGTCDFDLPLYALWLNLPEKQRAQTMNNWLAPFETVANAIALCLETIRNSADPVSIQAKKGFYEQALDNSAEIQLIRVLLDADLKLFPTISAGKQRFNIRLMEWRPEEQRTPQVTEDIEIKLMICGI